MHKHTLNCHSTKIHRFTLSTWCRTQKHIIQKTNCLYERTRGLSWVCNCQTLWIINGKPITNTIVVSYQSDKNTIARRMTLLFHCVEVLKYNSLQTGHFRFHWLGMLRLRMSFVSQMNKKRASAVYITLNRLFYINVTVLNLMLYALSV